MQIADKHSDWIASENCDAFDYETLVRRVRELAARRDLRIENLGLVEGDPLMLLTPTTPRPGPRLLIAAGFHGDEPAGCWGIVRFLNDSNAFDSLNISFLPLVNPTGFRRRQRINAWSEDPNRGFFHDDLTTHRGANEPPPSREGRILLDHLALLKSLATHSFLSLHEDVEYAKGYLYSFENSDSPGAFSQTLGKQASEFFPLFPDGPLEGGYVRDGIIFDFRDGSFEDYLFHSGIPRTASTESPGLAEIDQRVAANSQLIVALARYALAHPD
jgi:hypothetical protein